MIVEYIRYAVPAGIEEPEHFVVRIEWDSVATQ